MKSTKKISFNVKNLKIEENQKKKSNILRSKTLGVPYKINKLLTKSMNVQKCFQVMKLLRSNRGINDIENCKSLFKTFNSFLSYVSLNNDREDIDNLLSEIAWVIFHKKFKKNTLIKKPGEKNEFFYLLMAGKIQKVNVVFKKEKITLKEYLIYLLKMKLIKEYEVLKKCRQMNKSIMNINYENIEYFCEKNPKYNYLELLKIATDEIKNLGFDLRKINHNDEYDIPSIQNYLDVGEIKKDIKSQINKGPTIYLYIPKYELSCMLTKGDYFGFLTKDIFTEFSSYICLEDCDLGYINKNKILESSIFEQIDLTLSKYFSINKNKYYIFKDIDDKIFNEKYSSFINYQKYKKGDKIFLQGGINEGIYLINDGEINISSYTQLNDLTKLQLNLVCSLKGFQEHVPPSEFKNIAKENNDNNNSIKGIISYEDNKTNFDFGILKDGDILGLNELYDYKTSRYNFSAECISDEADVFFINKNNFNLILGKEKSSYCSVIQKVELRIKYLIGCIKNFRKHMPVDINKKPKNEMSKIEQNINYTNKPFIGKNLKNNFDYKYWNNNNKNISINLNKITGDDIPSIKSNSRNKSTANLNTINNIKSYPNLREKIMNKNDFVLKNQEMVKHEFIYNKNNDNDFNKYISVNILKYFTNKKPNFYQNYSSESKLTKNKTYNSLFSQKSYKDNCKIYNFTTPNKYIKKNSNNFIFNNTFENKNNNLPLLGNNLKKGNFDNNNKESKTIYFL